MSNPESLLPSFSIKRHRFAVGVLLALLSTVVQHAFGAWYPSLSVFALLFLSVGAFRFHLPQQAQVPVSVLVFLVASCVAYYVSQTAFGGLEFLTPGVVLLGILFCLIILTLFLMITARPFLSLCIGMPLLMLFATVNFYVYKCRGADFTPVDVFAFRTAMSVLGSYDLTPNLYLVRSWLIVLLFLFGVSALHLKKLRHTKLILYSLPAICLMAILFYQGLLPLKTYQIIHLDTYINGFYVSFMKQLQLSHVRAPKGYDAKALESRIQTEEDRGQDSAPTIIVIMNESFADLSVLSRNFQTDIPVTPFLDSLTENTIRGYALSSVYGGHTANSEYEFLTGHSLAFLPEESIPFQQYVRENAYSMVSELKARGYTCLAMHPYNRSNWRRDKVYPMLGFDKSFFLEEFGDCELVRGDYISDKAMYEFLIRCYEDNKPQDAPLFIFGVTMQNHGAYTYGEDIYPSVVHVEDLSNAYPAANEYLTLIHESDAALAYLVNYFSKADTDVVLVFFGDHQPDLGSPEFLEELTGGQVSTFNEQEKKYLVPFLVWANYDIEEQEVPLSSLNYLGNYVYKAAGITAPGYRQILAGFQETIPAINALGYYSVGKHQFLPISGAEGREAVILNTYAQLVYNCVFDSQNRLSIFQP